MGCHHDCSTLPCALQAAISASENPYSCSISWECWPTKGAGRSICDGVFENLTAGATTFTVPATGWS
jgi:hypothetical protein